MCCILPEALRSSQPEVSQAALYQYFLSVNELTSARGCKDDKWDLRYVVYMKHCRYKNNNRKSLTRIQLCHQFARTRSACGKDCSGEWVHRRHLLGYHLFAETPGLLSGQRKCITNNNKISCRHILF